MWGPLLFFAIMTFIFASIFWFAQPFMDAVDASFTWLASRVHGADSRPGIGREFIANGLITSFGAILVFVPQIFILFVGIGLLESTGYLARAATLIDRPFSKLGLTGRSFVPLLSGFSCAVPAIIASRNISSARDRWMTIFIIPLMTCSARLPVYVLLLSFVFQGNSAWQAGWWLAALYISSLVVGAIAAAILNRLIPKDSASLLLMELPLYRRPRFRVVFRQSLTRTLTYITRAGPVILCIAIVLWFGTNFPRHGGETPADRLEHSYAGRVGHWIEPVVAPMGVGLAGRRWIDFGLRRAGGLRLDDGGNVSRLGRRKRRRARIADQGNAHRDPGFGRGKNFYPGERRGTFDFFHDRPAMHVDVRGQSARDGFMEVRGGPTRFV